MNSRQDILFSAACAGILAFGFVLAVLGTLFGMPEMRARLHITLGQQGDVLLLLYLGIFISSLVVGPLIDRAGNKLILSLSSVLVLTATLLSAAAHSISQADSAAILLGLGGGGLCSGHGIQDMSAQGGQST